MKNTAVINGIGLRPPALRPLIDGQSSFQRVLAFARALPDIEEPILLLSKPMEGLSGARVIVRESWTTADLLDELQKAVEGHEEAFYFHADCPFLDIDLARRMHANHRRYWADYTFADGYPYGVTPEILTRDTVARLRAFAAEVPGAPDRATIFTLISKDINSFDIETEIAPTDMRLMRLSLSADTERNFMLLKRVVDRGGRDVRSACAALVDHHEIQRTLPAFYPIQIVERCPYACSYCPYPAFGGNIREANGIMSVEDFSRLVGKIADFSADAVVDISLWGEPAYHPRIFDCIMAALAVPGIDLVIETSGIGWEPGLFARVKDASSKEPRWIVSLDAASESVYRALRGEGFAEAERSANDLLSLFPARTWVQAVRMKENEEDLEVFFKTWKSRTDNVIIQKYDNWSGMLPERKVADLSPLKRFPCWHLKRDMAILLDGTVPLCREDVQRSALLGNALREDLDVIWARGEKTHEAHGEGKYTGICARCDEYYTYNF
jgi:spiro-SPASM protein